MMVVGGGIHGELLVAHPERWLAPGLDLMGLGQGETELA